MAVKKPDLTEIGATGTSIFSGQISPDENATFNSLSTAIPIYKQMRNDTTLNACLMCKELPIRAAKWWVQPSSDDPKDVENAKFVEEALFRRMSVTWDRFLHEVCLKFVYGFVVHEKVWKIEDGKVWLKKLAVRLPETLDAWDFDENGGPKAFKQLTTDAQGKTVKVTIPIEKLVIWTNQLEGSNLNGRSDLRACYREWWTKDKLQKLQLIDFEHDAVGVPTLEMPTSSTPSELSKARDIVQQIRKDKMAGVVLFQGWKPGSWPSGGGNRQNVDEMIHRYDRQMLVAFLAQFIDLGSGSVGSFALSADQSGLFLMALEAEARQIDDGMNRYVIPQLCELNGIEVKDNKYPELHHKDLGQLDHKAFADTLSSLASSNWLPARGEIDEKYWRRRLNLPEPEDYNEPTAAEVKQQRMFEQQQERVKQNPEAALAPKVEEKQEGSKSSTPVTGKEEKKLAAQDSPLVLGPTTLEKEVEKDVHLLSAVETLAELDKRSLNKRERLLLSIPESSWEAALKKSV